MRLPPIPGVSHLRHGIYRVFLKKGAQQILVQPLVGVEFVSFMKVSMVVLRGYAFYLFVSPVSINV